MPGLPRVVKAFRSSIAVLLCALSGHAVLYRSFVPGGPTHAYFGWYEPLISGLSGLALVILLGLAGAAAFGRGRVRELALRLLPGQARYELAPRVSRLALAALAVLLVQETVEESVASGAFSGPSLPGYSAIVLPLALAAFALLLAVVERSLVAVVSFVLSLLLPQARSRATAVCSPATPARSERRPSPLATGRGLRAPPLLAV